MLLTRNPQLYTQIDRTTELVSRLHPDLLLNFFRNGGSFIRKISVLILRYCWIVMKTAHLIVRLNIEKTRLINIQ